MYGKINIAPINFLNGIFVRVIMKAMSPPNKIEKIHAKTETNKLRARGSQKFPTAKSELNKIVHQL